MSTGAPGFQPTHRVEIVEDDSEQPGSEHPSHQDKQQHVPPHWPFGYAALPGQYFAPPPPAHVYGPPTIYQPQPVPQYQCPQLQPGQQMPFTCPQQYYQMPQPQPHLVAVNVKTDAYQQMEQRQDQTSENSNKTLTVKKKIVKNASRGLEGLLDIRVLATGLLTFLVPKVLQRLQMQPKKKRFEVGLHFGLGS